ncbi:MAG: heme A synthase [Burkholderiales bacterium]|nr:heme A synthase [Burkholderiales bacterium]
MSEATPLWNLAPVVRLALLGLLLASAPLAWVWLRHRRGEPVRRLRALTLVTLFLTFDLVLFGAFTRLTDSGLGCPDWPGCYGSVSPVGAASQINAAELQMPDGPVTTEKAWIEMIHRYLATAVGVLILVMTATAWTLRRTVPVSPWWPTATLVWVCLQGLFGALTVTMKLYPAIVTTHLLGGLGLLVLLALQAEGYRQRGGQSQAGFFDAAARPARWRAAVLGLALLSALQIALGGWVSTNYAVLACTDFPTCHGQWWPPMDFTEGFAPFRHLGLNAQGTALEMDALTAIHYTHRLMAYAVLAALLALAWALWQRAPQPQAARGWALFLAGVALWQAATGVSNVVLGWPLVAAVSHTGGAAVLVVGLATLWMRARSVESRLEP